MRDITKKTRKNTDNIEKVIKNSKMQSKKVKVLVDAICRSKVVCVEEKVIVAVGEEETWLRSLIYSSCRHSSRNAISPRLIHKMKRSRITMVF